MRRLPRSSLRILPPALLLLPHSAGLSRLPSFVVPAFGSTILPQYITSGLGGLRSGLPRTHPTVPASSSDRKSGVHGGLVPGAGLEPASCCLSSAYTVSAALLVELPRHVVGYRTATRRPATSGFHGWELPSPRQMWESNPRPPRIRHIAGRVVRDHHPTGRLRRLAVPCPGYLLKGGV